MEKEMTLKIISDFSIVIILLIVGIGIWRELHRIANYLNGEDNEEEIS
jgi:hypothetical protein